MTPYDQGYQAYHQHKSLKDNPYLDWDMRCMEWIHGFMKAEREGK